MPATIPIRSKQAGIPGTQIAFTQKRLEDYQCPPGTDRIELRDVNCRGLRLRVTANGVKTFCTMRRVNGRLARITIGKLGDVSLDMARKEVAKMGAKIATGEDPRAAKRAARTGKTFGELKDSYILDHAKAHKKSWEEDERQFKTYLASWNSRMLAEIQHEHVAALHAKIGRDNGHYVANRVLALLSKVFAFGKVANPCRGVHRFSEEKRDRFLQPAELPKFFEAVNAEPSQNIRDFIYIALLTGARRSNVLGMRWENVNLDSALWTIPKAESKSAKSMTLPLVPAVVDILKSRQGNGSEFVFPGRHGHGHLKDPMRAWRNILERAGIDNLRIHDLRRTFGSFQACAGVSLPIIGKSLGHSSPEATAIYSRLHMDPVRAAVQTATDAILAAAAGKDGGG